MRLKNPLRLGKNSDDRFSDFMLSENLACEVVVQKRILFLQREFSPSVENRARIS